MNKLKRNGSQRISSCGMLEVASGAPSPVLPDVADGGLCEYIIQLYKG